MEGSEKKCRLQIRDLQYNNVILHETDFVFARENHYCKMNLKYKV